MQLSYDVLVNIRQNSKLGHKAFNHSCASSYRRKTALLLAYQNKWGGEYYP
jgi:hypothetical protein